MGKTCAPAKEKTVGVHRCVRSIVIWGILLLLNGCAEPWASSRLSVFLEPRLAEYHLRRVMVLPFLAAPGSHDAVDQKMTALFCGALQQVGRFEVLQGNSSQWSPEEIALGWRGMMRARTLLRLAREYRVQGVILGRVPLRQELSPQLLSLQVDLYSTLDGHVLWAVDGVFSDQSLFAAGYRSPEELWLYLSPETFARRTCQRIAATACFRPCDCGQ